MASEKRLIDPEHLEPFAVDLFNAKFIPYAALKEIPTVDAVPVVRCHECQRSYKSSASSTGYRCKAWGVYDQDCDCDPNGFCHKGEKLTEEI